MDTKAPMVHEYNKGRRQSCPRYTIVSLLEYSSFHYDIYDSSIVRCWIYDTSILPCHIIYIIFREREELGVRGWRRDFALFGSYGFSMFSID